MFILWMLWKNRRGIEKTRANLFCQWIYLGNYVITTNKNVWKKRKVESYGK